MIRDVETIPLHYSPIDVEEDALAIVHSAKHPMTVLLVRVVTSDGVVGYGESLAYGSLDAVKAIVDKSLRPLLIGEDEEMIEKLWNKLYMATLRYGRRGVAIAAISGVDIALWDIMGKRAGKPIYKLLGGYKKRVRAYITGGYYSPNKDIEGLVKEVTSYIKAGFKAVKIKIGALSIEEDLERLKAVKNAVDNSVLIAVDANNVYTYEEALRMGKKLEELGIWFFEEPIQTDLVELSARLARELNVPIAGYETAFTRWEYLEILRKHAVDIVQVDSMWTGGISEFMKIGILAKTLGYPVIPHYSASGVSLIANLHVAAALGCDWIEFHLRPNDLRDKIFKEPILRENDELVLPERPGLGYEINEEILEDYRIK
jgi:D-arabinonate dehydratase